MQRSIAATTVSGSIASKPGPYLATGLPIACSKKAGSVTRGPCARRHGSKAPSTISACSVGWQVTRCADSGCTGCDRKGRLGSNSEVTANRTRFRSTARSGRDGPHRSGQFGFADIADRACDVRSAFKSEALPKATSRSERRPTRPRSKGGESNLDGSTGIRPFAAGCLKLRRSRVRPSAVPLGSTLHSCFGLWKATPDQPPRRVLPQPDQLPF